MKGSRKRAVGPEHCETVRSRVARTIPQFSYRVSKETGSDGPCNEIRRKKLSVYAIKALPVALALVLLPGPAWALPLLPNQNLLGSLEATTSCSKGTEGKDPVILMHGTAETSTTAWLLLKLTLENPGFCVFPSDYGLAGLGPIEASGRQLDTFVDFILETTGSSKVSIVAHSQGSLVARYYMRFLGGGSKVRELIGLAPSNNGTSHPLLPIVAPLCPACAQQAANSAFIRALSEGGDLEPGVHYTVVATRYDEIVIPYQSQFLRGSPDQVTNVVLQDKCPLELSEHLLIAYSPVAIQWVIHALLSDGPADPGFAPAC